MFDFCEDPITVGYGPCARPSDGKTYPQFIAEDLCYQEEMQRDLKKLPHGQNTLVSFSIAGASQLGNVTPLVPSNSYGYNFQVDRYLDLYKKSECYAFPEKDIFFYTDVGLIEFFLLINVPTIEQNTWLDTNLVQPVFSNIVRLYNEGKARKIFVQLVDDFTLTKLPAFEKLGCIENIDEILSTYMTKMRELRDALNLFAQQNVPNLDLTVVFTEGLFDEITGVNSSSFGIVNGNTMLDLGWPDKVFANQTFFDDLDPSAHTNRIIANFVGTWFQQRVSFH